MRQKNIKSRHEKIYRVKRLVPAYPLFTQHAGLSPVTIQCYTPQKNT